MAELATGTWTLSVGLIPLLIMTAFADGRKKLGRLSYLWRLIFVIICFAVIHGSMLSMGVTIASGIEGSDVQRATGMFVIGLIFVSFVPWCLWILWPVHRIQDSGWSKWCTLLLAVPVVNLVYIVVLLLWPGDTMDRF